MLKSSLIGVSFELMIASAARRRTVPASEASFKNQCAREKERAKPTVHQTKFCLRPIMLSNVFTRGAMSKMADF
jgi:hypothetical protein